MASDESPLLPEMKLIKNNGKWEHSEAGKESNISKAIGEAVDRHQSEVLKHRDPKKDSR
ncbi:MAG TPA: hypothetical protein VGM31_04435 [Puia sp.]